MSVSSIKGNAARIDDLPRSSLVPVTALMPLIGYDRAAEIATS